jgi:hypothetical protein
MMIKRLTGDESFETGSKLGRQPVIQNRVDRVIGVIEYAADNIDIPEFSQCHKVIHIVTAQYENQTPNTQWKQADIEHYYDTH